LTDSTTITEAKAAFDKAVASQEASAIVASGHALFNLNPTLGIAQMIVNTVPLDLPGRAAINLKIAFLRSYTVEPVIPLLRAMARLQGIDLTVKVGEFNSYAQEMLDPGSWLYQFNPDLIFLACQTRDIAPNLWQGPGEVSAADSSSIVDGIVAPIVSLIDHLRSRSKAPFIIQNLEQPALPAAGLLDSRQEAGQAALIGMVNQRLAREVFKHESVFLLDYDALIARRGREHWTDEKKWLTARAPIAADNLIFVAREYFRFIAALSSRQSKVLVVDLDNTLWGGVIGEDGMTGIALGAEYPGAAYRALQSAVIQIANRGILLAICSKNNPNDALEALEKHPEMLLRPKDFSAIRINWIDKAQNLKDIAAELNVGIDSLAFLDDNPVERQRVRSELPEVTVIDLPSDPIQYAGALLSCPTFERLAITAEDRARGGYYAAQRARKSSESAAGSLEDFYRSLEMKCEIVAVTPTTLARIAQLTQKTNQLNTTTKRYSESDVQAMARDPAWHLFGVKIADRFGDNGIVGVVFLHRDGQQLDIDTFLLSCRVIGRTVETMMLSHVCELGIAAGCTKVTGWFLPTKKNEPAAQIYASNGFTKTAQTPEGSLWELRLPDEAVQKPAWFELTAMGGAQ
jgi:FkbH-like protein